MLINTKKDYKYTLIDDRALTHRGCVVDLGCSGWDWCSFFIGKKRVVAVDPYESAIDGVDFYEGCVGATNGECRVIRAGASTTQIGDMNFDDDTTKVFPMLNWKTFCKKFNINHVSVLKINIEGGEYPLLNSMDIDDFAKIDQIAVSFHHFENPKFKELTESTINMLKKVGFEIQPTEEQWGWYLALNTKHSEDPLPAKKIEMNKSKVTIVTGLWDLKRGDLTGWAKRDFQQYKDKFFELLECDANMAIWIPKELEAEVWKIRSPENTRIWHRELEDFKTWFPFWNEVQKIRGNDAWKNFAGWLPESPQAALEFYNPMMMCKMFMVNDTAITNPFNSKYFYWIDGGLTNTVSKGYFNNDKVLDKLAAYTDTHKKFTFLSYPYTGNDEIHGFERKAMARYCNTDFVNYVCRGGFWGGKKEMVHKMNDEYYAVLRNTMTEGLMGADECLFTIMAHNFPKEIQRFELEGNGLVWPFFEMLKNFQPPESKDTILFKDGDEDKIAYIQTKEEAEMNKQGDGVNLYIVTFNSPPQLQLLLDTMEISNPELLRDTKKYLINNSIDASTDEGYNAICSKYGFTQIREGNLGVCGARSWAAKHFHESDAKYIVWFEDDMLMEKEVKLCKNGLNMHCDNWMDKCINIVENENLDFVKISFSEFYGDHHEQWAWYNIPMDVKQKYFPTGEHKIKLEYSGAYKGLSYLIGDVYYSNWPSVMTRAGNYKIFLETAYAHPFEQTIMSHCFQLSKKGRMRSAVLMASLVNHNRVYHYSKEIRKEC